MNVIIMTRCVLLEEILGNNFNVVVYRNNFRKKMINPKEKIKIKFSLFMVKS